MLFNENKPENIIKESKYWLKKSNEKPNYDQVIKILDAFSRNVEWINYYIKKNPQNPYNDVLTSLKEKQIEKAKELKKNFPKNIVK